MIINDPPCGIRLVWQIITKTLEYCKGFLVGVKLTRSFQRLSKKPEKEGKVIPAKAGIYSNIVIFPLEWIPACLVVAERICAVIFHYRLKSPRRRAGSILSNCTISKWIPASASMTWFTLIINPNPREAIENAILSGLRVHSKSKVTPPQGGIYSE